MNSQHGYYFFRHFRTLWKNFLDGWENVSLWFILTWMHSSMKCWVEWWKNIDWVVARGSLISSAAPISEIDFTVRLLKTFRAKLTLISIVFFLPFISFWEMQKLKVKLKHLVPSWDVTLKFLLFLSGMKGWISFFHFIAAWLGMLYWFRHYVIQGLGGRVYSNESIY